MVKSGSLRPREKRTVRLVFRVHCRTSWGQQVLVVGTHPLLGAWNAAQAFKLQYGPGDEWRGEIDFPADPRIHFDYKYLIVHDNGETVWESCGNRNFECGPLCAEKRAGNRSIELRDTWAAAGDPDLLFQTAPFTRVIFRRGKAVRHREKTACAAGSCAFLRLQVAAPRIDPDHTVCVTGGGSYLGDWDASRALPMSPAHFPLWTLDLAVGESDLPLSYKYIIRDKDNNLIQYEEGADRSALAWHKEASASDKKKIVSGAPLPERRLIVITDNAFRLSRPWRGAGVAVPLFSLRSKNGSGIGEFTDLKLLVDWAALNGIRMIQLLPVNDTTVTKTWLDSYPYSCVSVFALHPAYLNIDAIGQLPEKAAFGFAERKAALNKLAAVDYEAVIDLKLTAARAIFDIQKVMFLGSDDFRDFFKENAFWLEPYAAFCVLRDRYGTADFSKWGKYARATEKEIRELTAVGGERFDEAAFYYFLQFHCHRQFEGAARYARERRVVLKGDIPIGISKGSDSCWSSPELFNMDASAGAPPDPFSEDGQNWGFPTYNWETMAAEKFLWWKWRLTQMSRYFQMIRLDHVLGFFRIWEIPDSSVSGLMGRFNPAIPVWRDELERMGFWDFNRLCEPYITREVLRETFGAQAGEIEQKYLEEQAAGRYRLKDGYRTQRQIEASFPWLTQVTGNEMKQHMAIRTGLMALAANVILFRDPEHEGFHPRINMMKTSSFAALDPWQKEKLAAVYHDYFYCRQERFWREQGMVKLPAISGASKMLVCGEDLGMIPACVPEVMKELCILGLRIQRMPHEAGREFGLPHEYPYMTVCTTSSHDMPTLRGWWEEDRERTQRYYNMVLGHHGEAPRQCEPWIAQDIVVRHLESPSMWAVFPLQDLLAMSAEVCRKGDPHDEQINEPANPRHYWRYRMHLTLEALIANKQFGAQVAKMIAATGRSSAY